jgi:hypothetical protein
MKVYIVRAESWNRDQCTTYILGVFKDIMDAERAMVENKNYNVSEDWIQEKELR